MTAMTRCLDRPGFMPRLSAHHLLRPRLAEPLLADKPEHRIPWGAHKPAVERGDPRNTLGFDMQLPAYRQHRGELHNLSIRRGTLTEDRLFGFGMDAWRLAAYLDALQRDPAAQVRGATGELQLDPLGVVQRTPAWAVFSGGRARPALDGALLPDAVTP